MKAVVFHGVGDIRLDEVSDPQIEQPTDAIVRLTTSAICGTDLHMIRGTLPGMVRGTIMGHEGVGVVEEVGSDVRNLNVGDRVVIPSTIACGYCSYCRASYYAQCDNANPNGRRAGTAYFGGPQQSGPFHGLQAEKARIPFANTVLVKIPDEVSDDQAIFISDIFPTGYFGAELAEIKHGDTVAVFGCGPVGQFTIVSAKLLGAGRILAVDTIPSRLETAQKNGAEIIDFNAEDPIEAIHRFTGGIGVDRAIDAVGIDANRPQKGPAFKQTKYLESQFEQEMEQVAPKTNPEGDNWHQGDAPSLVLLWSVKALAKAGSLSIIGLYPQTAQSFPIGIALSKNLTIKMGNCNHRNYIPMLIDMVLSGIIDPEKVLAQTHHEPLDSAVDAYKAFDERQPGWIKVVLETATVLST